MPSNASLRLRRQFQGELNTREVAQARFRATVGDGAGNIEVPGKRNFIYIRHVGRSRVEECQNTHVPRRDGLPVIVGYDPDNPNILQVLEPDWGGMPDPDNYPYVPYHHESHEFQNANGGDDVMWVQKQQLTPLLAYPTDPETMTVNVYNGWYGWAASWHYFETTISANLAGSVPGAGLARFTLISIDGATEALQYTDGATFPILLPPADLEDAVPAAPAGSIPIVAVYLPNPTTSIGWSNLYDVRILFATAGLLVPHALLSATHNDTVTNAPTEGSLVFGNATPTWDELPRGTAHQLLKMNAAGLQPAWASFVWAEISAAVAANMTHDHSAALQGGEVPLASLGSYAQGRIMKGGVADWDTLAHPGAASRLLTSTAAEEVWEQTDDGDTANLVIRADANAAIRPNRLGVGTPAPNTNAVIAQAETADPAGGGAGTARIYPKDVAGQTKYYMMDDTGGIHEIAGIAENVTKTVGVAGDFATITAARNWFANWIIKGACIIDCDEAAYDEAVDFSGMLLAPGATLTLQGDDTHALGGISYADGAAANTIGVANGGAGTVALSSLGNNITVVMSTTNPDFDADGWAANDRILTFSNAGVVAIYTIAGVLNNIITLTVAAPAIGNDGTAICLLPDRSIDRSVAGPCVTVSGTKGIVLSGWYFEPFIGASCHGVYATNGALVVLNNVVVYTEDYGFYTTGGYTSMSIATGVGSAWGTGAASSYGWFADNATQVRCSYCAAVNCGRGFFASGFSTTYAAGGISAACTYGFRAGTMAHTYAYLSYCRVGTTGYYAEYAGYIMAISTVANNTAGTPYNPTPTNVFGNNNGHISFT